MFQRIKNWLTPKALVLMYHRVAELDSDVWEIAVSPQNFESQLALLKKTRNVVSVEELITRIKKGTLQKNTVAITFDDGYSDNYSVARPLLEKYDLPATFFIASGNIEKREEFWWDELEQLILFSDVISAQVNEKLLRASDKYELGEERFLKDIIRKKHRGWRFASEPPPTTRAALFLDLYRFLMPLIYDEQQLMLKELREWTGTLAAPRPNYLGMTAGQVQEISQNSLFSIEAHTVTHPALSMHNLEFQQHELITNQEFLLNATNKLPKLLAYPYGRYDDQSIVAAKKVGMVACFTTNGIAVNPNSDLYSLGRMQVNDWDVNEFDNNLQNWLINS